MASETDAKRKKGSSKHGVFEVEEILSTRMRKGKREYRLKWKGFGNNHNSWQPAQNLNCPELIEEFERKHGNIPAPRKEPDMVPNTSEKPPSPEFSTEIPSANFPKGKAGWIERQLLAEARRRRKRRRSVSKCEYSE